MLNVMTLAVLLAYPLPSQTRRLVAGMTEARVMTVLGEPDSVEQTTCGTNTPKPWACRLWDYREGGRVFTLSFDNSRVEWTLNSWRSF